MSSWKITQTKKQKSKQIKLAVIAISLILGLIFLSQIVKFTRMLFSPLTKSEVQRTYKWNGDSNINVLIRSNSIILLTYNPSLKKATIISIPPQTYLEVPGGLGKWQLSSVYGLGGDRLLKNALANFFAVPIDGYLDPVNLVALTDKNPLSVFSMLPNLKTDLTLFELFKLKHGISSVRFDKIEEINLEKAGFLEKSALADGSEVFIADSIRLDALFSDLTDPTFKSEHKTVSVFNCTNHPSLAQQAARLISNLGADVIIVSNGKNKYEKTQVSGEKSKTLDKIKQIFNADGTINSLDEDLSGSRAQINVLLGEEYFRSL